MTTACGSESKGLVRKELAGHGESGSKDGEAVGTYVSLDIRRLGQERTYAMTTPRGSNSGGIFLRDRSRWVMVCARTQLHQCPVSVAVHQWLVLPLWSSSCSQISMWPPYLSTLAYLRSQHSSRLVERACLLSEEGLAHRLLESRRSLPERLQTQNTCSVHLVEISQRSGEWISRVKGRSQSDCP